MDFSEYEVMDWVMFVGGIAFGSVIMKVMIEGAKYLSNKNKQMEDNQKK